MIRARVAGPGRIGDREIVAFISAAPASKLVMPLDTRDPVRYDHAIYNWDLSLAAGGGGRS